MLKVQKKNLERCTHSLSIVSSPINRTSFTPKKFSYLIIHTNDFYPFQKHHSQSLMAETNTNKTSYKVILNIILAHSIMISKLETFCELKKKKNSPALQYARANLLRSFTAEIGSVILCFTDEQKICNKSVNVHESMAFCNKK